MDIIPKPALQSLQPEWYQPYVAKIDMLRLDAVHPVVSGNKWYKLKHNLKHAAQAGSSAVLTFGGGYSNHLIATAVAANAQGLDSIGIVRGVYEQMTPTLEACVAYGMQLEFVAQEEYKKKTDGNWLQQLSGKYKGAFIIPEGGANEWGREGAAEIAGYIEDQYTHVCLSVGTGTTLAGICNALPVEQAVWGYVPMKNGKYLEEEIKLFVAKDNWRLFDDWHFGGFGKWKEELVSFMNRFYKMNNIPLDMVYTGKMMYGIQQQLASGVFPQGARVLCLHTGGLQGNSNIADKLIYERST